VITDGHDLMAVVLGPAPLPDAGRLQRQWRQVEVLTRREASAEASSPAPTRRPNGSYLTSGWGVPQPDGQALDVRSVGVRSRLLMPMPKTARTVHAVM